MLASILAAVAKALGITDKLLDLLHEHQQREAGAAAQRSVDQAATIQAAKDTGAVADAAAAASTDDLRRRVLNDGSSDA